MDDCIRILKAFPPSSTALKTDSSYHDALVAHVKSLDDIFRKHQALISSKAEEILGVRSP